MMHLKMPHNKELSATKVKKKKKKWIYKGIGKSEQEISWLMKCSKIAIYTHIIRKRIQIKLNNLEVKVF